MTRKITITAELSWKHMTKVYYGSGDYAPLLAAIEDGSFMNLIQACADQLHDGNVYTVLTVLSKNLSSQQTNMRKRNMANDTIGDWKCYGILRDYVTRTMAEMKGKSLQETASKPYYSYTVEEINAIPLTEVKLLTSLRDCTASWASKNPEKMLADETYYDRTEAIRVRLRLANKAHSAEHAETDAKLLAKLQSGSKATLGKAEAARLLELLQK